MLAIDVVGGSGLRQPVTLTVGAVVPNLTDSTVAGVVDVRGVAAVPLTEGDGITIRERDPAVLDGAATEPHVDIVLTGAQVAALPLGRIAFVAIAVTTPAGIVVPFEPLWLNRVR